MKYYRFPNSKVTIFGTFLLLFAQIMLVRDGLVMTALLDFEVAYALNIVILCVAGLCILVYHRKELKEILTDGRIVFALICALTFIVPMVAKKDWQIMYFSILLGIFVAIFFSFFMTKEEVGKHYVVILTILAGYSLFAHYVLKPMALSGIITPQEFVNSIDNPFYNFGLSYVPTWFWWYRNNGVFREPGVYQFFLILALYLNNYTISWKKKWKLWFINLILAVTILSTYSTNGIVELGLLAVLIFFEKKYYRNRVFYGISVAVVITGAALLVYSLATKTLVYGFLEKVFAKLFSLTNSTSARVESITVDLKFFLQHPIFGERVSTVLYAVTDNTTSTMIMFAILGTAGGILHLAGWIALVWKRNQGILTNLVLLTIFLMSFNTQNLTWDIMFWLFPMMALTEKVVPWLEEKYPRKIT